MFLSIILINELFTFINLSKQVMNHVKIKNAFNNDERRYANAIRIVLFIENEFHIIFYPYYLNSINVYINTVDSA